MWTGKIWGYSPLSQSALEGTSDGRKKTQRWDSAGDKQRSEPERTAASSSGVKMWWLPHTQSLLHLSYSSTSHLLSFSFCSLLCLLNTCRTAEGSKDDFACIQKRQWEKTASENGILRSSKWVISDSWSCLQTQLVEIIRGGENRRSDNTRRSLLVHLHT